MRRQNRSNLYLTIDQGGHASRALIFNEDGLTQSEGYEEIRTICQKEDWVEHNPEEMVASIEKAITKAIDNLGDGIDNIIAAGLATQRSSIVCWDKRNGEALSPIISWQDRRAASWIQDYFSYEDYIHRTTGLFPTAHYGVSKLKWCLDHLPAVQSACRQGTLVWGPMVSFLIYRLVDKHPLLVDPANASRTLLWNMYTLDWDTDLLNLFNIPRKTLPFCVPTQYSFGNLNIHGKMVPLEIVTGDQSAALFAYGRPDVTTAYINIGTGAFVQRLFSNSTHYAPKLLTSVVSQIGDEVQYVLEGTVNGAGSALVKLEQELGIDPMEAQNELPELMRRIDTTVIFLNGISGLGAPFWVPNFESRFIGNSDQWGKLIAVAESIAFLIQVNLEEMQKICPAPDQLLLSGGLAQINELCQRITDLSGVPACRPMECEATARGTAWLLMNKDVSWLEQETGKMFSPTPNPRLDQKYTAWKRAMKKGIRETRLTSPDSHSYPT